MELISAEAEEDGLLVFSDDEEDEKITDELDGFIDDSTQPQEDVSFYRQVDPNNIENYPIFHGQTRNAIEAIHEDYEPFYGHEDQQPELYAPEDRKHVSFDKFKGFERPIEKFKKTLKNFKNSKHQLFDAAIYGIMHYRCGSDQIVQKKIIEALGGNIFNDLKEIEEEIKLDRTFFWIFR